MSYVDCVEIIQKHRGFAERVVMAAEVGRPSAAFRDWMGLPGRMLVSHRTGVVQKIGASESPTRFALIRKTCHYPTFRDRWRGWLRNTALARSRVRREFENLTELARRGLNPPLALAYGERRKHGVLHASFLITRYLDAQPLAAPHVPDQDRLATTTQLADKIGQLLARFHNAGFVDRDFHLRNLLLADGRLIKIDCPRGRFFGLMASKLFLQRDLADVHADLKQQGLEELWPEVVDAYGRVRDANPDPDCSAYQNLRE